MSNLIPLNITIGDRSFRIRANAEDEETIRKTLKIINDKIIEFKTQFAGKDMQDYVSMVVIWYATQVQVTKGQAISDTGVEEALTKLEKLLG